MLGDSKATQGDSKATQGDGEASKATGTKIAEGWQTINRRKKREGFPSNPRVQTYIPYKTKPLYSKIHLTSNTSATKTIQKPPSAAPNSTIIATTAMSSSDRKSVV